MAGKTNPNPDEKISLTGKDYYNYQAAKKLICRGNKIEKLPRNLKTSLEKVLQFKRQYYSKIKELEENPDAAKPQKKNWGVLIYADGTNNLDPDINEMLERIESETENTEDSHFIIRQSRADGKTTDYLLKNLGFNIPSEFKKIFPSQVYVNLPGGAKNTLKNMGSEETLREFLTANIPRYPARHYLIMFKDHGRGHEGLCDDNIHNDRLTLNELEKALESAKRANNEKPIDVVLFDACNMGAAEVISQLEGEVKIVSASERTVYVGYTPEEIFSDFKKYDDPKKLAKDIVENQDPKTTGSFIDFCAVDLEKFKSFETELKNFAGKIDKLDSVKDRNIIDELVACANRSRVMEDAIKEGPKFPSDERIDLIQFLKEVGKNAAVKKSHPEIIEAAGQAEEKLKQTIITERSKEDTENGISIFFPDIALWANEPYESAYEIGERINIGGNLAGEELKIIQKTNWDKVIKKLLG